MPDNPTPSPAGPDRRGLVAVVLLGGLTLLVLPVLVNVISHHLTRDPRPADAPAGPLPAAPRVDVSLVQAEPPFDKFLKASPILMEVAGVKVVRLKGGRKVVLSVASTELRDASASERSRAEKVCRIKAAAGLLKEQQGVQIAQAESLREGGVTLVSGDGTGRTAAEVLGLTTAKVEGVVKEMPPVGRWMSPDGRVFYLATGAILGADGEPVAADDTP